MSFKIGGSSSKTSSTSNTNSSSTTKPVVPEWASSLTQNVAGRVGGLLNQDPQSLIAPAHALQSQAARGAAGLSGSPWNFDAAADLTRGAVDASWLDGYRNSATPVASAGRASQYVSDYLNPYLHEVVDATSADLDANDGRVRAQQALDLAGAGAFGGSGAALTQSMTEGELARARATTLGGLRSHAYDTAVGAAAGDADRATQASLGNAQTALQDRAQEVGWGFQAKAQQLAAGNQLGTLASAFDANSRANMETQASLGGALRAIDQEQRRGSVTSAQQIVGMLQGLPISLFTGEDKTDASSTAGTGKTSGSSWELGANVGKAASAAAGGQDAAAILGAI